MNNKIARLMFPKKKKKIMIFFVDEPKFNLFGNDYVRQILYMTSSWYKKQYQISNINHRESIIVWGTFSIFYKVGKKIKDIMNNIIYKEILETKTLLYTIKKNATKLILSIFFNLIRQRF